jgi:hypothetical protein
LEFSAPNIVSQRLHGHFDPQTALSTAIEEDRRQFIVAVGKDIGFHNNPLFVDALDREPAAVHNRPNGVNDDALAALGEDL